MRADLTKNFGRIKWKKMQVGHILAWTLLISYEIAMMRIALGDVGNLYLLAGHYLINVSLFYFLSLLILPNSLNQGWQWLWRLPILFSISFMLLIALKFGLDTWLKNLDLYSGKKPILNKQYLSGTAWRAIYFVILAFLFYYFREYVKERNSRAEFEKRALEKKIVIQQTKLELSKAKHAYLKSQINPHFLFNTLNYIFSLTQNSQPEVANAVVQLSNMTRFALEAEYSEKAPLLKDEIQHARNYINLWQIPKSGTLNIHFKVESAVLEYPFIPLIILTLLENIFKHGNLNEPGDPASMEIFIKEKKLKIETKNLINTGLNDSGLNLGIENIQNRIEAAYGGDSECIFSSTPDRHFITRISIDISLL
ncbi:sensor histidine kinase [Pedobacter aquatilis]|uniref:sensor histidine kinase n=1 Tax=Pedobacter aquatilis TaxID=351343 RepID=UPI00292CAD23|nr:histidine kinase [Pedobacter aquatilis]